LDIVTEIILHRSRAWDRQLYWSKWTDSFWDNRLYNIQEMLKLHIRDPPIFLSIGFLRRDYRDCVHNWHDISSFIPRT